MFNVVIIVVDFGIWFVFENLSLIYFDLFRGVVIMMVM